MSDMLMIRELSSSTEKYHLLRVFDKFGSLRDITIDKDKRIGYVKYLQSEDALKAFKRTQNLEILGRRVQIELLKTKSSKERERDDKSPKQRSSSRNNTTKKRSKSPHSRNGSNNSRQKRSPSPVKRKLDSKKDENDEEMRKKMARAERFREKNIKSQSQLVTANSEALNGRTVSNDLKITINTSSSKNENEDNKEHKNGNTKENTTNLKDDDLHDSLLLHANNELDFNEDLTELEEQVPEVAIIDKSKQHQPNNNHNHNDNNDNDNYNNDKKRKSTRSNNRSESRDRLKYVKKR
jgi:hypothetical protein